MDSAVEGRGDDQREIGQVHVEGDATAEELIAAGHDAELVMRIVRLVDLSEYKRRQMPPGVRVSPDHGVDEFMRDVEAMKGPLDRSRGRKPGDDELDD